MIPAELLPINSYVRVQLMLPQVSCCCENVWHGPVYCSEERIVLSFPLTTIITLSLQQYTRTHISCFRQEQATRIREFPVTPFSPSDGAGLHVTHIPKGNLVILYNCKLCFGRRYPDITIPWSRFTTKQSATELVYRVLSPVKSSPSNQSEFTSAKTCCCVYPSCSPRRTRMVPSTRRLDIYEG